MGKMKVNGKNEIAEKWVRRCGGDMVIAFCQTSDNVPDTQNWIAATLYSIILPGLECK